MIRSSFSLSATLCLLFLASAALAAGPQAELRYVPGQVMFEDAATYSRVRLPGTNVSLEPGAPELPVAYLRFVIPSDARVVGHTVALRETELSGVHRVMPAQVEARMGEAPVWTDENPEVYGSDDPYPADRVEYLGDGYLGGYRIATVAVHPLQYAPASGRLVLASDVEVELELAPAADRSAPRARMSAASAELYRKAVEDLVENPWEVAARLSHVAVEDAAFDEGFTPRYTPSLEGSPVDYVIITSDEFEPYFQDFADWKTRKGVPTVIRTVSWIESNYPGGVDAAERIRFFIKDAYESWGATFFLLGGDTRSVPTRAAWSSLSGGWDVVTDLYFSDLDGNWNDDGDALFGEGYSGVEAPGDSVDLYPDVFVGRAPASTVTEVETFVDKTLTYVKAPDPMFAGRSLYIAEVLFPYDWLPGELYSTDGAEHIVEPVLGHVPPEVSAALLYQNYEPFPQSKELTTASALDSINAGYNVVSHIGHGNKDILRVSRGEYITVLDIDGLSNGAARSGFFWMLDCSSTAIDFDCISEHLMNNPSGGASLLFGPTRFCFPTTTGLYYELWHEALYGGAERAGVSAALCKVPRVAASMMENNDRWTQLSYLLLGDPEARLWTDRPLPTFAIHDTSVPLGPSDFTVTVLDPAPVDSAYVCVAKDGEVYARGYTDASGHVTLSFVPQTTGTMTVTVTARNHYPYEDTIGVTSSNDAHLTLRSTTLNDDGASPSDGNGNGSAEAGETVELGIVVGNGGLTDATDVTAVLTSLDPYATILDGTESLGTVGAGSEVDYPGSFTVTVTDSCPNDHDVEFALELSELGGETWTDVLVLRVLRPVLTQVHNDYDDGGDGVPDVGETMTLTVTVLNEGNGEADLVEGELTYPNAEVSIIGGTDSWGDMLPGEELGGSSGFELTINAPVTELFELTLTDEDGKTWTHEFDIVPPAQPIALDGRVQATTVTLAWDPVEDADLWGYNVYRTDHPLGTFARANNAIVEGIAYYEDAGLDESQMYYYRVAAVDRSGNEGAWSGIHEISTNAPAQVGWPLQGGEAMYGSPAAADVDLDGDLEVLIGSGELYCWHHDGTELTDGDGDPRTQGVLADGGTGGYRSSVAVGQLDHDLNPEVVAAAWADVDPEGTPTYEVWAWNAEDGTPVDGWPVTTSKFCWATPNLADLDGDGLDEVVLPCASGYLYVWGPDGSGFLNPDGTFRYLDERWAYGSASVADIDQDGGLEIIIGSRSDSVYALNPDGTDVAGWPVAVNGDARASVAVGDVDGDGGLEVVAASNDNEVYVFSDSGQLLPNWPVACIQDDDFAASPTLADLDGDGDLEILNISSDRRLYVWTWEGDDFPGAWPLMITGVPVSDKSGSISVGNVDEDFDLEIIVGLADGKVYGYDTDGSLLAGWPIQTDGEIFSSPCLEDLDGDGDVEVIVSGMDGWVYVWDTEGDYADGDGVEWGAFRHDARRTGRFNYELEVGVSEGDEHVASGLRLDQNVPNPFNPVTTIAYVTPEGGGEIELAVYSVAGVRVKTLVSGRVPGGRGSAVWDGTDEHGASVASGVYFVRLVAPETVLTRKVVLLK